MVRLKSMLISAALLGLLSLGAPGAAFAETSTITVGNAAQTTARPLPLRAAKHAGEPTRVWRTHSLPLKSVDSHFGGMGGGHYPGFRH
ncbi:hypothetical protein [Bradyrhizobium septentrionale]|uniref:Uncharacterized protein n=1 Tax=Bradyrhizobium septentrionale TaxID=1404411 RepID=A0A973W494_9BRAD|nr:hypothetical protein [Bradyrhizobium septentrionale]UGY15991.1 hypothetical protein HAP48_0047175 [Bradyrhizobium septentrionale]UGY24565.1 hypothetical protein HU675_0042805 [Bradyrhizobium septentrionale]